jgi:hypothetical protein
MKRTMLVLFLMALFLAWGGSAVAQPNYMYGAAAEKCDDGDMFTDSGDAANNRIAFWPYFPSSESNWWNGVVMANRSDEETILKDTLCIVGVTADGDKVAVIYDQPIYPQNMTSFLKEDLSGDEWKESLYIGVFAKNKDGNGNPGENLYGFGLLGSKSGGGAVGGMFTDTTWNITYQQVGDNPENSDDELFFGYLPGNPWWSAVVLSNTGYEDVTFTVTVVHADGTEKVVEDVAIDAGETLVLTPTKLNEIADDDDDPVKWEAGQTVNIAITDGESPSGWGEIMGWAQFGNGKGSVGYFGIIKRPDNPA